MKNFEIRQWEATWNYLFESLGTDIRGLLRHGEGIEERRRLHPYPHEHCFCLPSDIPYEKAGIVLRLLATMRFSDGDIFLNFGDNEGKDILCAAQLLLAATPVLWSYDLLKVSTSGSEVFNGMPFDPSAFNPPMQLWIPDRDMILKPHEAEGLGLDPEKTWNAAGMLHIVPEVCGLTVSIHHMIKSEMGMCPRLISFQIFQTLDKDIGGVKYLLHMMEDRINNSYFSQVIASAEFMRQAVVDVIRRGPNRAERRRAEKGGRPKPHEYLHVKLRRREGEKTECGCEVAWSRRWIVRTHWRKQWYPSREEHAPVLIHSYIKGPEDMPLVTVQEKVVEVRR